MSRKHSGSGEALAAAASELIGTRFRLHGRDPAYGLDCVGLVEASLRRIGHSFQAPLNYSLRNAAVEHLLGLPGNCPARRINPACNDSRPGDIVLCALGSAQTHLLIIDRTAASDTAFIHAHAGLRRVVRTPGSPPWPVVARWRLD